MDPDKTLVEWAMRDLQCFGAETREEAAVALEMWSPMRRLRERSVDAAAEVTALVLARFSPAEPPAVPGLDWLPSPDEVASYTAAVAESLAVPAPVKALAAPCGAVNPFYPTVTCDSVKDHPNLTLGLEVFNHANMRRLCWWNDGDLARVIVRDELLKDTPALVAEIRHRQEYPHGYKAQADGEALS